MDIHKILAIVQIVISALLVIGILLQQRGAGGSAITGGSGGGSYYTKRGFEKILFIAIIVLASLFTIGAIASMYIATRY
jgi:protein translocase SecG subunit